MWATPYIVRIYKDIEEGSFCILPVCPYITRRSIPSLALEPTSSGFRYIQKNSGDSQPCGTNQVVDYWIFHSQLDTVGLADLQPENQSHVCEREIHSISSVTLENIDNTDIHYLIPCFNILKSCQTQNIKITYDPYLLSESFRDWVWRHSPVIPTFRRWEQGDCLQGYPGIHCKSQASLYYIERP